MACSTCALKSMKAPRPYVSTRSHAARTYVIPKAHTRHPMIRCTTQGPQDNTDKHVDSGVGKCGDSSAFSPRRRGFLRHRGALAPSELALRRAGDYIDSMRFEAIFDMVGAPIRFRRSPFHPSSGWEAPLLSVLRSTTALNIEEDEKEYLIQADVPGFGKDNIKVTVSADGVLCIEGHETDESEDENSGRSKRVRNFVRKFQLPDNVNQDGIVAKVENGVLSLSIPKTEEVEELPKQVPIN